MTNPCIEVYSRVVVRRLPSPETTEEGPFYTELDGEKVGFNGRAFWQSIDDAKMCGFVNAFLKGIK